MTVLALRLLPGSDLKSSLDSLVLEQGIPAACILTCTGSLTQAAVRFAGKAETTNLAGPLEIVSLTGTLSPDGSHLHCYLMLGVFALMTLLVGRG